MTEEAGDVAELAAVVADAAPGVMAGEAAGSAGPAAAPASEVGEPTVVVTGGAGEVGVEEGANAVDVCVEARGDRAAVAAWAGWENRSMTVKIPVAASAACIAARATRRTTGCMSSSHLTRNRIARLPSGGGANLAHTENTVRPPPYS